MIIEPAPDGGYWAICPEVPDANCQGVTVEEAKQSLRSAIRLIIEDRVDDARWAVVDFHPFSSRQLQMHLLPLTECAPFPLDT